MKKIFVFSLLLVALFLGSNVYASGDIVSVPAAKAAISGKVIDNATGEYLAGVAVMVEGSNTKVYSDLDGNFTINGLTPGSYNLVLSLISYKNSLVENLNLKPNETEILNVKLDVIR